MKKHSRCRVARRILLFWTLFVGIGAVAGAVGMLADPSGAAFGMDGMLPYFRVLPFADMLFRDLTFSGIALLIVNGLTNLTAAALILAGRRAGVRGDAHALDLHTVLYVPTQLHVHRVLCFRSLPGGDRLCRLRFCAAGGILC